MRDAMLARAGLRAGVATPTSATLYAVAALPCAISVRQVTRLLLLLVVFFIIFTPGYSIDR